VFTEIIAVYSKKIIQSTGIRCRQLAWFLDVEADDVRGNCCELTLAIQAFLYMGGYNNLFRVTDSKTET
jgi:hypothetical protein